MSSKKCLGSLLTVFGVCWRVGLDGPIDQRYAVVDFGRGLGPRGRKGQDQAEGERDWGSS